MRRDEEQSRQEEAQSWRPYLGGETLGQAGSEGGTVLRDQEHPLGARATLEEKDGLFVVTCGVYGLMVHTACVARDRRQADESYARLLPELAELAQAEEPDCQAFVERW